MDKTVENKSETVFLDRAMTTNLKAIAILMVIAGHILGKYWIDEYAANLLGTGGVSCFLILSGYGLYSSYLEKGISANWWKSKALKIYCPYLLTTLIFVVLFGNHLSAKVIMDNVLLIDYKRSIDGTMWYLSFLLIWYICFFVLFTIPLHTWIRIAMLFGVAFWIKNYGEFYFESCAWQFTTNAMAFPVGILIAYLVHLMMKFSFYDKLVKGAWLGSIPAAIFYTIGCISQKKVTFGMLGFLLFVFLYGVLRLLDKNKYIMNILSIVGANSYILYLVEGKFFIWLSGLDIVNQNSVLFVLAFVVLCVIACFIWSKGASIMVKDSSDTAVPYLIMAVIMCIVIANKVNFDYDEPFSYGSANHIGSMVIEYVDGETYIPASKPFDEYMTVAEDNRFNYANVWANQAADVHPPLYYAIVHTVCSLFPGTFSMWYGGCVNIVFMLLTLLVSTKLMGLLVSDKRIENVFAFMFAFCTGMLSAVSFYRMYIVAMFCCTSVTYLLIRALQGAIDRKFYIGLMFVAVLGALTHYYCIVYTVLACVVFGIILLCHRKWRQAVIFSICELGAGGISVLIYPAMIKHMFLENRGTESLDNLANNSLEDYWNRIKVFWQFLNSQLGANLIGFLVLAMIICVCLKLCKVRDGKRQFDGSRSILEIGAILFIPAAIYFLLVAKIAAYTEARYMYPIYAVVLIVVFWFLHLLISSFIKSKEKSLVLLIGLATVITMRGWELQKWPFLHEASESLLEASKEYADVDCIIVHDIPFRTQTAYFEMQNYRSSTFISRSNLNMIDDLDFYECNELIVLLRNDEKDVSGVLNTFINAFPQLDAWEEVGGHLYTKTYHLYGEAREGR